MGCSVQLLYHGNSFHYFIIIMLCLPLARLFHSFKLSDNGPILGLYRIFVHLCLLPHVFQHPLFTLPLQVLSYTGRKAHVNILGFLSEIKYNYKMHFHLHEHILFWVTSLWYEYSWKFNKKPYKSWATYNY